MTEREKELQDQIDRLRHRSQRQDEERWDKVEKHLDMIPGLKKTCEETSIALNGPPTEPEKGIKVKVDRLEQKEESRKWWSRAITGASVSALVTSVWAHLRGS